MSNPPTSPIESVSGPPRRLPAWLRRRLPTQANFARTRNLLHDLRLATVCESARCPNHWECWERGTATFMIGGDRCTRACGFCAVDTRKPFPLDPGEPERVAEATQRMGLRHVVITAVARDDVTDGGASHFRATIKAVRRRNPGIVVEVLVPDFKADDDAIRTVLAAKPEIFNHNIETVPRLTPQVRHRATYPRSLHVLRRARELADYPVFTKSGMMLGLGESEAEIESSLRDLRAVECDLLTLGQYLQPTPRHLPVQEYLEPGRFEDYRQKAEAMGFVFVASGPLVRSSYHADDFRPEELLPR